MIEQGSFPPIYNTVSNWNPHQLEIEYFWPLTEQIPLDLDYTGCATKNPYVYSDVLGTSGQTLTFNGTTGATWSSSLHIDSETITFNNLAMPWYRKLLFKLMGFKWKK